MIMELTLQNYQNKIISEVHEVSFFLYHETYKYMYCAFHVLVQKHFRQYYFYSLPDQALTHLNHWKVLD